MLCVCSFLLPSVSEMRCYSLYLNMASPFGRSESATRTKHIATALRWINKNANINSQTSDVLHYFIIYFPFTIRN